MCTVTNIKKKWLTDYDYIEHLNKHNLLGIKTGNGKDRRICLISEIASCIQSID
jgi:hypothetical protein